MFSTISALCFSLFCPLFFFLIIGFVFGTLLFPGTYMMVFYSLERSKDFIGGEEEEEKNSLM